MALEPDPEQTGQPGLTEATGDVRRAVFDPGRQVLIIGLALVALVILTVVAVLLAGSRTVSFPEDSAEHALQQYLQAFEDGDLEAAYAFFSSDVQQEMSLEEFEQNAQFHGPGMVGGDTQRRVSVDRVEETDDGARIHLVVQDFYGGGLGSSGYSFERTVRMTREQGAWRIDEPLIGIEPGHAITDFEEVPPPEPAP